MARLARSDVKVEKGTELVPAHHAPATLFPRWMERFEDLLEGARVPFFPMLRFPEEVALRVPPLDVYEEGGTIVVKAELPGMKKEEIEVQVAEDVLTISGRKEKEEKVERKDYRRIERASGAFTRTLTLPGPVEAGKVTATYKDGVLEIRAPRLDGAAPKGRKIEVS